jgi:hypothetical protein
VWEKTLGGAGGACGRSGVRLRFDPNDAIAISPRDGDVATHGAGQRAKPPRNPSRRDPALATRGAPTEAR